MGWRQLLQQPDRRSPLGRRLSQRRWQPVSRAIACGRRSGCSAVDGRHELAGGVEEVEQKARQTIDLTARRKHPLMRRHLRNAQTIEVPGSSRAVKLPIMLDNGREHVS